MSIPRSALVHRAVETALILVSTRLETENNVYFLPRDASAERGDATVSCPSVRPSVCDL